MRRGGWLFLAALVWPGAARASEPTTDCVVRDHRATWTLQTDGSADVLEQLSVDCGTLSGKHGIYRILPTQVPKGSRPDGYRLNTPVSEIHVMDATGNPYTVEQQTESGTLKLKIGDAAVTITGQHEYVIAYHLANAVYPNDQGQGVVSLNVVGQFWQLPIDKVEVEIDLPGDAPGLTPQLARGAFGSTTPADTATASQPTAKSILITDATTYAPETGLTVTFTAPASLWQITNYKYTALEKWGGLIWLLWPIVVLWGALRVWRQYGRDVKLAKAHMVQYEPPKGLAEYEAYQLQHNGTASPQALSGLIVGLAVKGYLKLERQRRHIFGKQVVFTCVKDSDDQLSGAERAIMSGLFGSGGVGTAVESSKLRFTFRTAVTAAQKAGADWLKEKGWFESQPIKQLPWLLLALAGIFASGPAMASGGLLSWIALPATWLALIGVIWLMVIMPRRTADGAEVEWQLRGFQDYLKTAEKYRLKFSEKENLFEKYLPYAVAFGVVEEWARAMRNLYGDDYWAHYHPIWYVGNFDVSDIASFTAEINSVAADISSAMSAGTGGGASGGGAGGGGGGSW